MAAPKIITSAEYLERERAATERSELVHGQIVAMSGARLSHVKIVGNLTFRLRSALPESCDVLNNDMRVAAGNNYFYPDVIVTCGDIQLQDDQFDTLTNPLVVIEVLSPSTEAYDLGIKLRIYAEQATIRHILFVASDRRQIDHYRRTEGGPWFYETLTDGSLTIQALGVGLNTDEVYERVSFEPAQVV